MATIESLAALKPRDINEALECMREALDHFHARDDYRAVFLRAYYIITKNVSAAIRRQKREGSGLFLDPAWMSSLAGEFATLYFRSLTTFQRPEATERAWKLAHGLALDRRSTVVQDLLLGINAHVNYDLAFALHRNILKHYDDRRPELLAVRNADHGRANTLLMQSIREIWSVIPREYGGELRLIDTATVLLDRWLAMVALKYCRARVWEKAMRFLQSRTETDIDTVVDTLNCHSTALAERIAVAPILRFDTVQVVVATSRRRHYAAKSSWDDVRRRPLDEIFLWLETR